MGNIFKRVQNLFTSISSIHRDKAVQDLEWEVNELTHIFALLTIGNFVGLPSAPMPVSLSLLPEMHEEFAIMLSKLSTANNPLSDQFSKLDVV